MLLDVADLKEGSLLEYIYQLNADESVAKVFPTSRARLKLSISPLNTRSTIENAAQRRFEDVSRFDPWPVGLQKVLLRFHSSTFLRSHQHPQTDASSAATMDQAGQPCSITAIPGAFPGQQSRASKRDILWATFPSPTTAISDLLNPPDTLSSWTLALGSGPSGIAGLSHPSPARMRRTSENSLSNFRQDHERWARIVSSSRQLPSSSTFPRTRGVGSLGDQSSAGDSSEGDAPFFSQAGRQGMRFDWRTERIVDNTGSTPSSPSSGHTFGGGSLREFPHARPPRVPRRSRSSSGSGLTGTASYSHAPESHYTSNSRRQRSDRSDSLMEDRRVYNGGASLPSLQRSWRTQASQPFSEDSWEFQVAQNLYMSAPPSVAASSQSLQQSSSSLPSNPSPSDRSQIRSKPRQIKGSVPPLPPFPTHERTAGQRVEFQLPNEGSNSHEPGETDSEGESEASWHDAEEGDLNIADVDFQDNSKLFEVKGSMRAAVAFAAAPTKSSLFSIIHVGPSLSPAAVIDIHELQQEGDPFSDEKAHSVPGDGWSVIDVDEDSVVIPLPTAPLKSAVPQILLHSPSDFLPATPRELRRSYRREQRLSAKNSRIPATVIEVRNSLESSSRVDADSQLLSQPITSPPVSFQPPEPREPSVSSSISSKRSPLSHIFPRTLALVPLGAWLFVAGWVFPPLWWLELKFPLKGPMSTWPDRRTGAREPDFTGDPRGGFERVIEGKGRWWEIEPGWQTAQQSILVWRKRNRVKIQTSFRMAILSVFLLAAIVAVAVWASIGRS
ncbi:hypothetical protein T439DRAFT_346188 [Meredithblackwellia eburnea MCA 4105]